MAPKTILAVTGVCALVAGVAMAGCAAQPAASAASAQVTAPATLDNVSVASAVLSADSDSTTASDDLAKALGKRHDLLCARVPLAIERTEALEKRLAADASTEGSLAWLQAQIDAAAAAHDDQRVTVLKNRLAYRRELASFLPARLQLLQTAQGTICAGSSSATATS